MPASEDKMRQRREKIARMRAVERRRDRRNKLMMVAGAGVAVVAVAGGTLYGFASSGKEKPAGPGTVQTFTNLSRNHVAQPVNYPRSPPVGGDHSAAWQNCGIYSKAVTKENAVHSLEHGAVWLTYQPSLAREQVSKLQELARGKPFVLLSPLEGLKTPVAASAWGKQLTVSDAGDSRLLGFVRKYAQSPQAPEPGAPCTNGIGQPDA